MVNINLLPWREYQMNYQKQFMKKCLLLNVLIVVCVLVIIHLIIAQNENRIKQRIDTIGLNINRALMSSPQTKINTNKIENHSTDFTQLSVKLFSEFEKMRNEKVCFSAVEFFDKSIIFSGQAYSLVDLTEFYKRWSVAYLFSEMQIKTLEKNENGLMSFVVQGLLE